MGPPASVQRATLITPRHTWCSHPLEAGGSVIAPDLMKDAADAGMNPSNFDDDVLAMMTGGVSLEPAHTLPMAVRYATKRTGRPHTKISRAKTCNHVTGRLPAPCSDRLTGCCLACCCLASQMSTEEMVARRKEKLAKEGINALKL